MFADFYLALAAIGFTDPVHATMVHMPIALVVAALIFGILAFFFRGSPNLLAAARYCFILAFLFFFPTVLLGYMDWQHYYQGAWLSPVKAKVILSALLFLLMVAGLYCGRQAPPRDRRVMIIYVLCFLNVVALGYFGGRLVFGGGIPAPAEARLRPGALLFGSNCSACHANGGNALRPYMPLGGSDKLAAFDTFLAFIRDPKLDNGLPGPMPPFPPEEMPEKTARELYEYLQATFATPKAEQPTPVKPGP